MNWQWRGKAWVFGHDVPNDNGLMPIRFVRSQEYDPAVLAKHCFEDLDPAIAAQVAPGDLVVGGRWFGRGNPHVQGFLGLQGLGVAVIAESMQRGAYRACVNSGLPVLAPVAGVSAFVSTGDTLSVDFETGLLVNEAQGTRLQAEALPMLMREIIGAGGGMGYMHRRLAALGIPAHPPA